MRSGLRLLLFLFPLNCFGFVRNWPNLTGFFRSRPGWLPAERFRHWACSFLCRRCRPCSRNALCLLPCLLFRRSADFRGFCTHSGRSCRNFSVFCSWGLFLPLFPLPCALRHYPCLHPVRRKLVHYAAYALHPLSALFRSRRFTPFLPFSFLAGKYRRYRDGASADLGRCFWLFFGRPSGFGLRFAFPPFSWRRQDSALGRPESRLFLRWCCAPFPCLPLLRGFRLRFLSFRPESRLYGQ